MSISSALRWCSTRTLERAVPRIEDFEAGLLITRTDHIALMPATGNFPEVREER